MKCMTCIYLFKFIFLDLARNNLRYIHVYIMNKTNQLCMIDAGITTLDNLNLPESLNNLNLHYNSIHDVGDNLAHLFNLKYLDLSSNKLKSTLGLSFCLNLQVLNLASNQITTISNLEKLRYLLFFRVY